MKPTIDPGPMTREEVTLETDTYIETYKIIADWIRFADTKAAATLTVNGVFLGLLIPTLKGYLDVKTPHPLEHWTLGVVILFLVWLGLLVLSAVNSFLCILPIRGLSRELVIGQATHFHPAAVTQRYPLEEFQRFVDDCETMGMSGLKREIMAAIMIDSHLSSAKYRYVTRSIWFLAFSVIPAFLYLLAIQF